MPICCMCHEDLPASAFAFRSIATGVLQAHCRRCHAAYRRQHYLDNRETYIGREVARIDHYRRENRVLLFEYLSRHPCVDCGEADVVVLEFDHRDPATKEWSVSHIAMRKPWKLVLAEIEKCDVRCVNCHRKRTAAQFNWSKAKKRDTADDEQATSIIPVLLAAETDAVRECTRCGEVKSITEFRIKKKTTGRRATICRSCARAYGREHYRKNRAEYLARAGKNRKRHRGRSQSRVLEYLAGKSCVDCGQTDPVVLEFDHRDGAEKEDDVARLIVTRQWTKVDVEIAKCDIRCANCHRRRTAEQFGWARRLLKLAAIEGRAS